MGTQGWRSEQVQRLTLPQLHSASPHFLLCPVDMILSYFMRLLQMCSGKTQSSLKINSHFPGTWAIWPYSEGVGLPFLLNLLQPSGQEPPSIEMARVT